MEDDETKINIWDWRNGKVLASCNDSCSRVRNNSFLPIKFSEFLGQERLWQRERVNMSLPSSTFQILSVHFCPHILTIFATAGLKSIKFWTICGSYIEGQTGLFGRQGTVQTMLCLCFGIKDLIYSGSLNGDIYCWKQTKLENVFKDVHRVSNGCEERHRSTPLLQGYVIVSLCYQLMKFKVNLITFLQNNPQRPCPQILASEHVKYKGGYHNTAFT